MTSRSRFTSSGSIWPRGKPRSPAPVERIATGLQQRCRRGWVLPLSPLRRPHRRGQPRADVDDPQARQSMDPENRGSSRDGRLPWPLEQGRDPRDSVSCRGVSSSICRFRSRANASSRQSSVPLLGATVPFLRTFIKRGGVLPSSLCQSHFFSPVASGSRLRSHFARPARPRSRAAHHLTFRNWLLVTRRQASRVARSGAPGGNRR